MAIGGRQLPLHELTAALGAQPAAYRHDGRRALDVRADRARLGLHPCGVDYSDPRKTAEGHGCLTCKHRVVVRSGSRPFSACALAMQRIDRRTAGGGRRAHQVRLKDPACALWEDGGVFAPCTKKGDEDGQGTGQAAPLGAGAAG